VLLLLVFSNPGSLSEPISALFVDNLVTSIHSASRRPLGHYHRAANIQKFWLRVIYCLFLSLRILL